MPERSLSHAPYLHYERPRLPRSVTFSLETFGTGRSIYIYYLHSCFVTWYIILFVVYRKTTVLARTMMISSIASSGRYFNGWQHKFDFNFLKLKAKWLDPNIFLYLYFFYIYIFILFIYIFLYFFHIFLYLYFIYIFFISISCPFYLSSVPSTFLGNVKKLFSLILY